ncbi:gated mechanosensitive channel [Xylariaceae sp. FL0662B]|nr:gated mechanosensitive channel [Xylariaceae sp. FL0662B]
MPTRAPWQTVDDDEPDAAEEERRSLLREGERKAKRILSGFIDFAFSGNILEIAFGLILATAFTSVTTSFVSDILLPPLSVLFPLRRNMDEKFAVLRPGPHCDEQNGYNTLKQANDDGAVVLAYGVFVNKFVNFLGMGVALYALASLYQWVSKDNIIKHSAKCPYCKKRVSEKAIRCVNCTSWLDGREDRLR